jgi:hypothetical protein
MGDKINDFSIRNRGGNHDGAETSKFKWFESGCFETHQLHHTSGALLAKFAELNTVRVTRRLMHAALLSLIMLSMRSSSCRSCWHSRRWRLCAWL